MVSQLFNIIKRRATTLLYSIVIKRIIRIIESDKITVYGNERVLYNVFLESLRIIAFGRKDIDKNGSGALQLNIPPHGKGPGG